MSGEGLTIEYIKKGNTLWNVEGTGIEDITNLCYQDHARSRNTFEMTSLTKDFYEFIETFFKEKPKAKLERSHDDFSFEGIVRGLHGEVIENGEEWEKIKIICTHSSIKDPYDKVKCICRVDVMLSTVQVLADIPMTINSSI